MSRPPTKQIREKDSAPRSLVINRLERVSKDLFRKYYELITELVSTSPGVYAPYDDDELSAAAKAVVDRSSVNGWQFWYIEDVNGDKVKLHKFKE